MRLKSLIRISLLVTMCLFALNFALNFWNAHLKNQGVGQLQQETRLLAITTSTKQGVVDIQKQVTRLGQLPQDSVPALNIEERDKVETQAARAMA